jgi:glycosyltransferase involved in cell wall biosynthesis
MIKLLSIVIAYRNRRQILLNTLKSIEHFGKDYPIEVILVDDGSSGDQQISDISRLFPNIDIKLIVIRRNDGVHRGPTIACNTGFNYVKGDVILLNNADCLHLGDIIGYVFENFEPDMYMTFAAYKGWSLPDGVFDKLDWDDKEDVDTVLSLIRPDMADWHFHTPTKDKYAYIPYSSAINTKSIEAISGYDERFAYIGGLGYEDADFVARINNLGLRTIAVDDPFCVHQKHPKTLFTDRINLDFFLYLEKESPKRIKITSNTVYKR